MFEHLPEQLILVLAAVFMGGFVHAATGFGFALVVMPIAASALDMAAAVPMMNFLAALLCAQNLYSNRRGILWGESFRLMAGSLPGLFCGSALLHLLHPQWLEEMLGSVLLGYAAYAIRREFTSTVQPASPLPVLPPPPRIWLSAIAGFSAGFFGGACAADGPPVVVYGDLQRWPKERFRAVLQAYFVFNGFVLTAINLVSGYLSQEVLSVVILALPALFTGSLLGYIVSGRLDSNRFRQVVLAMVMLMAANLLLR